MARTSIPRHLRATARHRTDPLQASRAPTRASRTRGTKRTKAIRDIKDFKVVDGQMLYLCTPENEQEEDEPEWLVEEAIESRTVLDDFREKMYDRYGYAIDASGDSLTPAAGSAAESLRRSTRTSKLRAFLRFSSQPTIDVDSSSEDEHEPVQRKRKRTGTSSSSTKKKSSAATDPSRLRGKALLRFKEEQQELRKKDRAAWVINHGLDLHQHATTPDCCLRCSTMVYRRAVLANDVAALKKIIDDRKTYPMWTVEDVGNQEKRVLQLALIKGNQEIIEMLQGELASDTRIQVPGHILSHGSSTGYISRHVFGHFIRQVNESRGNRLGNASFYRDDTGTDFNVDMSANLTNDAANACLLGLLHTPFMDDPLVLASLKTQPFARNGEITYQCVVSGHLAASKTYLDDYGDTNGFNFLHAAVFKDEELPSFRKTQILKKTYAANNMTPLHCAAIQPTARHLEAFFQHLDAAERMETDDKSRNVIHYASASSTPACLQFLLDQGLSLNQNDRFRLTPLIQAARFGRSDNVKLILTTLSDGRMPCPDFANHTILRNKRRALHYAAYFGHADTCQVLLQAGATVDIVSSDKMTPMLQACRRGHLETVKVLVEDGQASLILGDRYSRTPLHQAAMYGHLELAKYLLLQGADANAPDTSANTPAHYAAAFGHQALLHLLLTLGQADASANNVWRGTPCSVANMKGHVGIVQYLLTNSNAGLTVNFRNQQGQTMLHETVVEDVNSSFDIDLNIRRVKVLLEHNANVNFRNMSDDTVLHALVRNASFKAHELGDDKKLDEDIGISYQLQLAQILMDAGSELETVDNNGNTPLMTALITGNYPLAAFLINHGANYWSAKAKDGRTFFHYFLLGAASLDNVQPYEKLPLSKYQEYSDRFVRVYEDLWQAVADHPPPADQQTSLINEYDNQGYTPVILGIKQAIEEQKTFVKYQKSVVKYGSSSRKYNGQSNDNVDDDTPRPIRFVFCFDHFISFASRLFSKFKPDLESVVKLPRKFFAETPKVAKKPDQYPIYTGYSALHLAAHTQHVPLLTFLMDLGADPNQQVVTVTGPGATPIILGYFTRTLRRYEYINDNSTIAADMIKKRFDITMPDFDQDLKDTIAVLLQNGADPCFAGDKMRSAFMKASSSLDAINISLMYKYVMDAGGSDYINHKDAQGNTALSLGLDEYQRKASEALTNNTMNSSDILASAIDLLCPILLALGADLNVTKDSGDSILMRAMSSNIDLFRALLAASKLPLNHAQTNKLGQNVLAVACASSIEVTNCYLDRFEQDMARKTAPELSAIVNNVDKAGFSALVLAATRNNVYAVKKLTSLGAKLEYSKEDKHPLSEAISCNAYYAVEALLEANASLSWAHSSNKFFPMHFAVKSQKPNLVRLLLKHGADVNAADRWGQTPLHWAIELSKKQTNRSMKVEQLLIDAGANVNAIDNLGRTPLHIVFTPLHVVPWTKETDKTKKKLKILARQRESRDHIKNSVNDYIDSFGGGSQTLDTWIRVQKRDILEAERQREEEESKQKATDQDKQDAEHDMMDIDADALEIYSNFKFEQDISLESADPVDMLTEILSDGDIQLDVADIFGRTALHYAIISGAISCMTVLLDTNQVSLHSMDQDLNGPLQLALRYNHAYCAVIVVNRGAPTGDIRLPNNTNINVLHYSLSKSFMNVSYLFLKNTSNVLECLAESLSAGKFHFANRVIRHAGDHVLSGTVVTSGQNLWHIISNFAPFDSEIWNDYLPDYLETLEKLQVPVVADAQGYTPLHYAAKHGQTKLMSHLLKLEPTPPLIYAGEKQETQMILAVHNNRLDTVMLLQGAGLPVGHEERYTKTPSMLYHAIDRNHELMVRYLLQNGVSTDADSAFGRSSPLGLACIKNSIPILRALAEHSVKDDIPYLVELSDKNGKKWKLHVPLLIYTSRMNQLDAFKILLTCGSDPNVLEPEHEMFDGYSCLMYCVKTGKLDFVKALLEAGADLGVQCRNSNRSIFYEVIFGKKVSSIKFDIYDLITRHSSVPDVNAIDTDTGMTPLEFAIRNSDIALIDRLLSLGADPNVESCSSDTGYDLYNEPVNALFHAMLQDDIEAFKMMVKSSKHTIDWEATDRDGRTLFSRMAGIGYGYSYKHLVFFEYLITVLDKPAFKKIIEIPTNKGFTAAEIAKQNMRQDLHDEFCKNGAKRVRTRPGVPGHEDVDAAMDVVEHEPISIDVVQQDAEAEIALLLDKKAAEKASQESDAMDTDDEEDDGTPKIDSYSQLENVGVLVYDDDNERHYDIMLMKVDISHYHHFSKCLFYKLSVIYNKLLEVYVLWTRWGGLGTEGMHQKTPYLTKEEAVREFLTIFRAKSGNHWHDLDRFESKPGRYQLIKSRDPIKDMAILDDQDLAFVHHEIQPSQLPKNLHKTMTIFCNFTELKGSHKNVDLGIPIGQVPSTTLIRASKVFDEIKDVITELEVLRSANDPQSRKQYKEMIHKGVQLSTKYYSLLPMKKAEDGLKGLLNPADWTKEMGRLNDVKYIDFTLNVVLAAKHRAATVNPFDYSYRTLDNKLTEVSPESMEFSIVNKYMATTTSKEQVGDYEIAHLFSIDRKEEQERFKPFETDPNRKLLWHGSQLRNFMGILKQGLRTKPSGARHTGALLGDGIYFADMFRKSMMFTPTYDNQENRAYAMLLLCEVALGDNMEIRMNYSHKTKDFTSVMGAGHYGPNPAHAIVDATGMEIPVGPCMNLPMPEGYELRYDNRLSYNEYVVEDQSRVKMKYLVLVRNKNYCDCCESSSDVLNRLDEVDFEDISPINLNRYELDLMDMYMHSLGKTRKQFVDEHLDDFWTNNESYFRYAQEAQRDGSLALEPRSRFCSRCISKVYGVLVIKHVRQLIKSGKTDDYPFLTLNPCRYGSGCDQITKRPHVRKYHHWMPSTEKVVQKQPFVPELLHVQDQLPSSDLYCHVIAKPSTDDVELLSVQDVDVEMESTDNTTRSQQNTTPTASYRPIGARRPGGVGLGKPGAPRRRPKTSS
ncbi:ankyrin [Hesseltinella vesiculosa]|uniref:Poly [ADP-ribose] polymerase n=1 Tax=Hesseltinella vesiculosa TaxID=101127 RepID=A0A1X2GFM7_9FUNG|nr:ankyrin [Hesseltinella vesiculosa]